MTIEQGRHALTVAIQAISELSANLDQTFQDVVELIHNTKGRVILVGMGKSGIICRKIAATFASTGTPSFFVHSAEAVHGDLGMIIPGDTVIAISNSGETAELVRIIEFIKRQGITLIAITGVATSTLATTADKALTFNIEDEGCPMGLAPMASTTTTLALGDALAAATLHRRGFTSSEFANFHPGGKLGQKLMHVADAISTHQAPPLIAEETTLSQALIEMSEKRLGMTAVQLEDKKLGLITDGDIRRLLQKHGPSALDLKAGDVCTREPRTISPKSLAVEALKQMEDNKITSIIVMDGDTYTGVVHLHDLWKTQLV